MFASVKKKQNEANVVDEDMTRVIEMIICTVERKPFKFVGSDVD